MEDGHMHRDDMNMRNTASEYDFETVHEHGELRVDVGVNLLGRFADVKVSYRGEVQTDDREEFDEDYEFSCKEDVEAYMNKLIDVEGSEEPMPYLHYLSGLFDMCAAKASPLN